MSFFATMRLRRFLSQAFQTSSFERFDGVPIGMIDAAWFERGQWVPGALACYRAAVALRDRARYPLTVAISFALEPRPSRAGVTFRDLRDLDRQLDASPPVLTVLGPEDPEGEGAAGVPVHVGLFGLEPRDGHEAELIEWCFEDDGPGEWFRSVLLMSKPVQKKPLSID